MEEEEGLCEVGDGDRGAVVVLVGDGEGFDDEDEGGEEDGGLAVVLVDGVELPGERVDGDALVAGRQDLVRFALVGVGVTVVQG